MRQRILLQDPVIEEIFLTIKERFLTTFARSEHWLDYCSTAMELDMRPLHRAVLHSFSWLQAQGVEPHRLNQRQKQTLCDDICEALSVVGGHPTSPLKEYAIQVDEEAVQRAVTRILPSSAK